MKLLRQFKTWLVIAALMGSSLLPLPAQQPGSSLYRFRVNTDLVLVTVTARDRQGKLVSDLKQDEFTVLEDGKAQHITSFDLENVQNAAQPGPSQAEVRGAPARVLTGEPGPRDSLRDRRLMVLFFDFTSMQPDEVARAMGSAERFVEQQMSPADLVSVVTLGNSINVAQDFTSDRAQLRQVLRRIHGVDSQGMESGASSGDEGQPDTGQSFTADDSEYNIFNTDRKLQALAAIAESLSRIDQKKSILFFSGGAERTGTENQSQLRAAINVAVRSNVSIYAIDVRGLQALTPGGSAQQASLRGTSAYSGRAVLRQFDSNFASQETLTTLAADTGGQAFLDSNDFSKAFERVQADMSAYYVLGYRSTNKAMDGRFRRITVRSNRRGLKLEYRSGYYGPRDFQHFTRQDREQQMEDELASDLPSTDLPVYVATQFFRSQEDKYFVPVSVVVPGSAIPFTPAGDREKASLDLLGIVRERQTKMPIGSLRETLKVAAAGQGTRRNHLQYDTGFLLPPGNYHLKFVVRENQNGKLGSFESDVTVPDLKRSPLKMSSVVISSQRVPAGKKSSNPLVRNGNELVPNVAHVFSAGQQLYFYYEVYDPSRAKANGKSALRLLTSIQFFNGKVKAYETPVVEAHELNLPERKAAAFEFEIAGTELRPGWYTCQVNVIDDVGATFAFPRLPLLVRAAQKPAAAN